LAKAAIDARAMPEAQAAFYLLRSDVLRMRTRCRVHWRGPIEQATILRNRTGPQQIAVS
jgi:hypothetical protein